MSETSGVPSQSSVMGTAVVLLSGGLDSATVLAQARTEGWRCLALTVRYGQRHEHEVGCAQQVARVLGAAEHRILPLDLSGFGGSALFPGQPVPPAQTGPGDGVIPTTYVPARNTVFLSLALAWAEASGADAIYLGVNALDYSGYPDCRPEYLQAFQAMADLATRRGVEGRPIEICAPLLHWSKAQIIARGLALGVDYSLTTSCYDPSLAGQPCGRCDACSIRRRGFQDAGVSDPLRERS